METHRIHSLCKWSITWSWKPAMSPRDWSQDCGIARRCKLFLGTELERGALVQEGLFVWPPMERRREFAAPNLQAESYLEREHNARWAALGVGHATSGITANRKLARNGVRGNIDLTLKWCVRLSPVPLKRKTEPDHRSNLPLFAPAYFC